MKLKTGNRLDPAWQQVRHFPRVKVQSNKGQDAVATVLNSDSLCGKVHEKPELHWKWKTILCLTQTQRVTISSAYVQQLSRRRLFFIRDFPVPLFVVCLTMMYVSWCLNPNCMNSLWSSVVMCGMIRARTSFFFFFFFNYFLIAISVSNGSIRASIGIFCLGCLRVDKLSQIWNRTRPRALVQNQQTRELISARKTSHRHSNKDLIRLRELSPGRGTSSKINMTKRQYINRCVWWCTSGGVSVRCIYTHARWELRQATRVFVVVLVWRTSFER